MYNKISINISQCLVDSFNDRIMLLIYWRIGSDTNTKFVYI